MGRDGSSFIFWILALLVALFISIAVTWRRNKELSELRNNLSALRKNYAEKNVEYGKLVTRMQSVEKIVEQRNRQFPWLASAIADFHALEAERDAKILATKKHPAVKSALMVREYGLERREAEYQWRLTRYRVEYYEKLFPWIADYVNDDVPDAVVDVSASQTEPTDDPVKNWLNDAEYQRLSVLEKNQLALDRWRTSAKSNWQIGRDYERFIGYIYETHGYDVLFTGAIEGLEDMGRDIIARRGNELRVIQCKYRSQSKTINEKHIFQLFGSALEYSFRFYALDELQQLSLFDGSIKATGVRPVLHTSTNISDLAKEVAEKLHLECHENIRTDYPLVKCNISMRDGQRIYHLPFDQQYDRTKIKPAIGEKYVYTVAEAEDAGFRRAWKWRPN